MAYKGTKRPLGRIFVIVLLVIALGLGYVYYCENHIQTEVVTVASDNLPEGFAGFNIVQISDLHGKIFGEDHETLLAEVAALEPDIIAITGDLIDDPAQLEDMPALAEGLVAIAPTYYITGNHEWSIHEVDSLVAILEECGVTYLSNEYVVLEQGGDSIVLAGIDDPNGPYDQMTVAELMELIREEQGDAYVLLLAHRNTEYKTYENCGADLVVTGHGHGGLMRLPIVGAVIGNGDTKWFPDYTEGLYELEGGTVMMVSRGLGNGTPVPRIGNCPHLPTIILETT